MLLVFGHVGRVASELLGLLPDIEMNDTSRPAIQHCQSKQHGRSNITTFLGQAHAFYAVNR